MTELLKAYRWPLVFGLIGLALAILMISVGFFKTLLILLLTALGLVAGWYVKKSGIMNELSK